MHRNKLATALANKLARISWGVLRSFPGEYLTTLLRGLYYEGWHSAKQTNMFKSRDAFLERIREGVHRDPGIDAEQVAHAVFALLAAHLPASELEDVKAVTPKELRAFWPI